MSKLTVVSGGQTGADVAALFAARQSNLLTGGIAPTGYVTTFGKAPWLKSYNLTELPPSNNIVVQYIQRSKLNVDRSDATVAFSNHPSSGTDKTIGYALTKTWKVIPNANSYKSTYKPCLIISTLDQASVDNLVNFITSNKIKVLNVCGHRETDNYKKEWTNSVTDFLKRVFSRLDLVSS